VTNFSDGTQEEAIMSNHNSAGNKHPGETYKGTGVLVKRLRETRRRGLEPVTKIGLHSTDFGLGELGASGPGTPDST